MVLRDECLHPEWLWRKELVCFVLLLAASCFATSAVVGVGVQSCCRRLVVDCRRHVAGHCCWHAVRHVVVEVVRKDLRRCVGVVQVEELVGRCRFGASFRRVFAVGGAGCCCFAAVWQLFLYWRFRCHQRLVLGVVVLWWLVLG